MTIDSTFEFEKRRNIPVKYSRKLWNETIEAIKRIDSIKQKRESHYLWQRLKKGTVFERERDRKEVKRDMALIKSPAAGLRVKRKAKVIVERETDHQKEEESDEDQQMVESSENEEELIENN